jgi:hypothetical protein
MINSHSTAMAVFEFNMAAAREDHLRPVLYKWERSSRNCTEMHSKTLGSKNPSADVDFILHTID